VPIRGAIGSRPKFHCGSLIRWQIRELGVRDYGPWSRPFYSSVPPASAPAGGSIGDAEVSVHQTEYRDAAALLGDRPGAIGRDIAGRGAGGRGIGGLDTLPTRVVQPGTDLRRRRRRQGGASQRGLREQSGRLRNRHWLHRQIGIDDRIPGQRGLQRLRNSRRDPDRFTERSFLSRQGSTARWRDQLWRRSQWSADRGSAQQSREHHWRPDRWHGQ
jgi:hypothetical protein